MHEIPGISSNHPALLAEVNAWLAESRMPMPRDLRLRLEVADSLPSYPDSREVFSQGEVKIRAGEPLGWVHVTWRDAAVARVDADRPDAQVTLTPAALTELDYVLRSFLLVTLIFLWKRDGHFHMHGGTAVDPSGRGWLLVGNSQSGKSTTTALLAARGWAVGTDDIAFLTKAGERAGVVGFRSPIALRPGGAGLLGRTDGVVMPARGKTGYWPEDFGTRWIQTIEPDIVVFTEVSGPATRITRASPAEVMRGLLQWSMWVMFEPTGAQEHLDLLARLGRQAQCYHATLAPDLFDAPRALEDFLP